MAFYFKFVSYIYTCYIYIIITIYSYNDKYFIVTSFKVAFCTSFKLYKALDTQSIRSYTILDLLALRIA